MPAGPSERASYPQWEGFVDSLRPIGTTTLAKVIGSADPQLRQELAQMLLTGLVQGYLVHLHADPDYPEFTPALGRALNVGAPVPDFMYRMSPLVGQGIYRISGNRGTSLFADLNVAAGYWAAGTSGGTLNSYNFDDLMLSPAGDFEVILSGERPASYRGDWWYLDPRARRAAIRRAAYDWLHEIDPRIAIERLDLPARRPRRAKEEISQRMEELSTWAERVVSIWLDHLSREWNAGVVNRLEYQNYIGAAGASPARGQVYLEGFYDLEADEALLIDTEVPATSRYWSFLVTDQLWGTLDWMHRFSSINGHQAKLSSDGRFRAAVSAEDPGVPNWLDIGGYRRGVIQVRWNNASSAPKPTCTKVKLREVRSHMPADTPSISPAERDVLLRARRQGAQMRIVW